MAHRVIHLVPVIWRLHKVHHSSERLDWLAAARVHPLESVWNRLIALLPLFLLGFSPWCQRSKPPAGDDVAQPAVAPAYVGGHSADREALNKNYSGLLPLFDFLFGTERFPQRKPLSFGLADERAPAGFWQQLLWPFRANATRWSGNRRSNPAAAACDPWRAEIRKPARDGASRD